MEYNTLRVQHNAKKSDADGTEQSDASLLDTSTLDESDQVANKCQPELALKQQVKSSL